MILVIAAEVDVHAMDLAIAWADQPAKRVTSRDLSSAGWSMTGGGEPSTFVVEGERHGSEEVDGILVRLPAVQPSQLTTIAEDDRDYAAAEMTAFLSAWLSEFGSRVVNRPSPAYLAGPPWSNEEWLIRAARRGVRTVDVVRGSSVGGARAPIDHWVTFVGDHAFGQTRGLDTDAVRGLAQSAGVKFFSIGLCAESGSPAVAAVDLTPPAGSAEVRDALLRLLRAARS